MRRFVGEFLRYAVVGGVAFVADFAVMVAVAELVFKASVPGVYAAVACGFAVGLVVNYLLSLRFVFRASDYSERGRSVGAFVVFGVIGAIGLGFTELGMWLGTDVLSFHYTLVKVVVTGSVLVWNYLARRIAVFGGHGRL